jgi:hypothetical protein
MTGYLVGMSDKRGQSSIQPIVDTPWEVVFTWPEGATQGGPRWVEIRPQEGMGDELLAGGLSSTILRHVDFQAAAQEWREHRGISPVESHKLAKRLTYALGSSGVSDRYLVLLADAYVRLVTSGEPKVTARLAEIVGKSPETIRAHIKAARSRGLLTALSSGRAGGELTSEARRILEHASIAGNKSYRAE